MVRVDLLKNVSSFKSFKENTVIIHEGEEIGDQMYIVLEGKACVCKNFGEPEQLTLTELNPGDFFGEMTLFLNRGRTATVIALSPMKVLEITRNNAYQFFASDPEATYLLIQALCSRIENLNDSYMHLHSRIRTHKAKAAPALEAVPAPEPVTVPAPEPVTAKHAAKPVAAHVSDLFPKGHKLYTLPEAVLNKDLLRNETVTCPICGNKFNFPIVRTVKLRTLSMDYDMRRYYEGINATHYLAATCPKCLFSAIADKFSDASKSSQAEVIKIVAPLKKELGITFEDMDANTIFTRLYLAVACAPICYDDSIMFVARLWINISWLYRDCGDPEMEHFAMEQALKSYLGAYTTVHLDKKVEQTICMIIGELSYKLGNTDEGKKFLFAAKTNRDGAAVLSNLAEDRLLEIKELEAQKDKPKD